METPPMICTFLERTHALCIFPHWNDGETRAKRDSNAVVAQQKFNMCLINEKGFSNQVLHQRVHM